MFVRKFKAGLIIGNDLLQKSDSILSYAEKQISVNGVIIPFIGNDGDYNYFDRTNSLVADFEYVSRTNRKKVNRSARKLFTVEANVVQEKDDIKNSGYLGNVNRLIIIRKSCVILRPERRGKKRKK